MEKLRDLYNQVFDEDGEMKLCGREKIEALAKRIREMHEDESGIIGRECNRNNLQEMYSKEVEILRSHGFEIEKGDITKEVVEGLNSTILLHDYFKDRVYKGVEVQV